MPSGTPPTGLLNRSTGSSCSASFVSLLAECQRVRRRLLLHQLQALCRFLIGSTAAFSCARTRKSEIRSTKHETSTNATSDIDRNGLKNLVWNIFEFVLRICFVLRVSCLPHAAVRFATSPSTSSAASRAIASQGQNSLSISSVPRDALTVVGASDTAAAPARRASGRSG